MQSKNEAAMKQSLLSSLEIFQKLDNFPKDALHPFASNASKTCDLLQDLINTTEQISTSLRLYEASAHWTNSKLVSLLRQHATIEHTAHTLENGAQHLVNSLRARSGVHYGETIPLNATDVPDWCIQQLVAWGTLLGMEAFQGDENQGGSTVVMGGKVLVIDIDFATYRDGDGPSVGSMVHPKLEVVNVKTSNALLAGNSSTSGSNGTSTLLDSFLLDGIREYCAEMQRDEDLRDSQCAADLRRRMVEHLKYLVLLDGLSSHKDGGGIRWFTDVDELYPALMELAKSEAHAVAASFSSPIAPLDIFLLRCHSLPLPYLLIPSLSFLVHVSPSAYLHFIRNSTNQKRPITQLSPLPLDITVADIKKSLATAPEGVTIATLHLQKLAGSACHGGHHIYPGSMTMPNATPRPTFPLSPSASESDHVFPQINTGIEASGSSEVSCAWMLDFTQGGKRRGIVMSQSRMKAIELVVNPLAVRHNLSATGDQVAVGSWIDLLMNPENPMPSERYTALYKSSNFLHPPLQLRLAAPEEPGYILDSVPIHSMKEIWGILEIVREQCWLNETLLGCNWVSETLRLKEEELPDSVPATEEGLQAVLSGTFSPRKIPVNVFIPTGNEADDLFGTDLDFLTGGRPKIVMTCPERAPISGLVEITITYDEKKARGVSVMIQGAVGLDINASKLEEVCRRGGTWGLPGRIWTSGRGFS